MFLARHLSGPQCVKQRVLLRTAHAPRRIATTARLPERVKNVELPKLIIADGSAHHDSLSSFLEYAERVKLAPTKTVYIGTHFEYTVALALMRLGFALLRTGGSNDGGIDLIGHWVLPQFPEPVRVIVQCKARTNLSGTGPKDVRELEGAFQGIPADWKTKDVLGLLVSSAKASRGVLQALGANRRPVGFLKISRTGTIEQFCWNRKASERGLEGLGVTVRHTPRILLSADIREQGEEGSTWDVKKLPRAPKRTYAVIHGTKKDIQLTWMGKPIFPDREGPDSETVQLVKNIAAEGGVKVIEESTHHRRARNLFLKFAPDNVEIVVSTERRAKSKAVEVTPVKRKPGRPPGSKNRTKTPSQINLTFSEASGLLVPTDPP